MEEDLYSEDTDTIEVTQDYRMYITCPICGHKNKSEDEEKQLTVCQNCNQLLIQRLPNLERLRKRLLDLTNRNKLLNFRHPKRSSLKAVDELPDFLYEQLLNDNILTYIPVSEPTEEEIEKHEFAEKPTSIEWGEILDISTSFEMPHPTGMAEQIPEKHVDKFIQTLLFPQDLEATLRRIRSLSQTAIEESGTNMLYLAFGFLKWTESTDSKVKRVAPLMLMPVILEKNKKASEHGTYLYSISYSGESISANLSLKEKLFLDLGIELPEIEEDELPESYFTKIQKIIEQKPDWKLKRGITLSLFHFGRQLMYLDLDPERWPKGAKLTEHPIVKKYFEGVSESELEIEDEYNIDEYDKKLDEVPLIEDADSSQHSALIDAINGKSIVIEGPPGTGKSQTITNLIGAAINNNKTVLFVSEKLAALEVVRRKLDNAELGIFCLELHSHKTQKRRILDEIEERFQKKGTFLPPATLNDQLELLENAKKQLKRHTQLINQKVFETGQTIQEVLCAATRYRRELSCDHHVFSSIDVKNVDSLTSLYLKQSEESFDRYLQAHKRVCINEQNVTKHSWYGITNSDLVAFEREHVVKLLEKWVHSCVKLNKQITEISTLVNFDIFQTLNEAQRIGTFVKALPKKKGTELFDLFPKLIINNNSVHLNEFIDRIMQYKNDKKILSQFFENEDCFSKMTAESLELDVSKLKSLTENNTVLSELDVFSKEFEQCFNQLAGFKSDIEDVLATFGLEDRLGPIELANVIDCLGLCVEVPMELVGNRDFLFDSDQFDVTMDKLELRIKSYKERKSDLSKYFEFSFLPPKQEIKESLAILTSAGLFKWFDSKWWKAKKVLKSICTDEIEIKPKELNPLRQLVAYLEESDEFKNSTKIKRLLKDHFVGIETDINGLKTLRDWYKKVRSKFGFSIGLKSNLGDILFDLPIRAIQGINQLSHQGLLEYLIELNSVYCKYQELLPKCNLSTSLCFFSSSDLNEEIEQVKASVNHLYESGIDSNVSLKNIDHSISFLIKNIEEVESISNDQKAHNILGNYFSGVETDIDPIQDSISFVKQTLIIDEDWDLPEKLLGKGDETIFDAFINRAEKNTLQLKEHNSCLDEFLKHTHLETDKWLNDMYRKPLNEIIERANYALNSEDSFNDWVGYLKAVRRIEEDDLGSYIDLLESGKIGSDDLINGFFFRIYDFLSREVLSTHKALRDFQGYDQEQIRKKFQEYDKEIIRLCRSKIASKVDKISVPEGNNPQKVKYKTEASLLRHEIGKKTRHIPIRQLMRRSGKALQALKPCFMMGPHSVAQFLKPGDLVFDILIVDEASQMRPEDAIGAIGRSKQIVIVGDPKQLPPTSFFQRMFDAEETAESDEITGLEESESILDATLTLFKHPRRLTWHYRSRHEHLIQFSNKYFYNNTLNVFPSPFRDDDEYGIKLINIPNGRFIGRKNMPEAQQIAKNVIDHMKHSQDETLGIVAMNITQKELIEDEIERLVKESPEAQNYYDMPQKNNENIFIKNLENVQGDERDVIFISMTYGPDDNGAFHQRFGPINTNAGSRRLNVLFTRARKKVVVFSSLLTENINVGPNTKPGVKALRDYLVFAERGRLSDIDDPGRITQKEPDSDFEIAVSDELKKHGYNCEPQIGVERYFIDIGVYHPDLPGTFILGVECDGAPYHSGKSVRDRDRLRENVLTGLGWKIHRIWSTDWYQDPESEIKRLIDRIESLRLKDRASGKIIISESEDIKNEVTIEEQPSVEPTTLNSYVELNDTVTFVEVDDPDNQKSYQIINGKTDASVGVINEHTPIAQLFLESEIGDEVHLKINTGVRDFEIIDIKKFEG